MGNKSGDNLGASMQEEGRGLHYGDLKVRQESSEISAGLCQNFLISLLS